MSTWQFAVPFIELTRGGSRVGLLNFFCLYRITCLHIPITITTFTLLTLVCYLHFAFCLFVLHGWSNSNVPPSNRTTSGGSYLTLRGWESWPWSPELLRWPKLEERPDLKGGEPQTPLHTMTHDDMLPFSSWLTFTCN